MVRIIAGRTRCCPAERRSPGPGWGSGTGGRDPRAGPRRGREGVRGEEAREPRWSPTGSSGSPHPSPRLPGFPLGSGFPVSVLGDLQQQVLVCQPRLQRRRRRRKRGKGRRKRRSGCGCGCGRAAEERGGRRESRVRSRPRNSGAGGRRAEAPACGRAGGQAWGSLPLALRPSGGRGGPGRRRDAAARRRAPGPPRLPGHVVMAAHKRPQVG